jgi:hypothetical protein
LHRLTLRIQPRAEIKFRLDNFSERHNLKFMKPDKQQKYNRRWRFPNRGSRRNQAVVQLGFRTPL